MNKELMDVPYSERDARVSGTDADHFHRPQ